MKKLCAAILIAALAVVVADTALAGAAGKTRKIRTRVTVSLHGTTFSGKVKAKKAACRKHRKVTVFHGSNRVGATKSSSHGSWKVRAGGSLAKGNYYAKVSKRRHAKLLCKKAKSKKVTVHGGGGGGGGGHSFSTDLTIAYASTGPYTASFSGSVGSSASACVSARDVAVFRQLSTGDEKIGHASSNGSGAWHVDLGGAPPNGTYYASTPKTTPDSSTTCEAGRSSTTPVP
jgi:hypothetical protein